MTILSSFTHPQVVPNIIVILLLNSKEDILTGPSDLCFYTYIEISVPSTGLTPGSSKLIVNYITL